MDEGPLTLSKGVIKVFIDLWITTLPIPWVMQTQMKRRQRYLVALLFALGYVVTGAGAARVYYTWKVFFTDGDLSWWLYPTLISSTIENNLAIVRIIPGHMFQLLTVSQICACAPTIRPLFPHLFGGPVGRIRGWISAPRSQEHGSGSGGTNDEIQYPARAKSEAGLCKPSPEMSSWSGSQADDVELVIQKPDEATRPSEKHIAYMDVSHADEYDRGNMHSQRGRINVRVSDMSGFHPFDPRMDGPPRRGSWLDAEDVYSFRSDRTLREDVLLRHEQGALVVS